VHGIQPGKFVLDVGYSVEEFFLCGIQCGIIVPVVGYNMEYYLAENCRESLWWDTMRSNFLRCAWDTKSGKFFLDVGYNTEEFSHCGIQCRIIVPVVGYNVEYYLVCYHMPRRIISRCIC